MKISTALISALIFLSVAPVVKADPGFESRLSTLAGYAAQSLAKYRALSADCGGRLAEVDKQMFVDRLVASGRFGRENLEAHIEVLTKSARMTSGICDSDYSRTAARAFDRERRELFDLLD